MTDHGNLIKTVQTQRQTTGRNTARHCKLETTRNEIVEPGALKQRAKCTLLSWKQIIAEEHGGKPYPYRGRSEARSYLQSYSGLQTAPIKPSTRKNRETKKKPQNNARRTPRYHGVNQDSKPQQPD